MSLIGMTLEDAKAELLARGMEYTVVVNSVDENMPSDTILVTNEVLENGITKLVVSPFLIEVDREAL